MFEGDGKGGGLDALTSDEVHPEEGGREAFGWQVWRLFLHEAQLGGGQQTWTRFVWRGGRGGRR